MRHEARLVFAVSVVLAIAFVLLAAPEFRFTGDTENYVGLARAIAGGEGLARNTWQFSQFPPGFPLILAPAAWLFHGSFAAVSRWAALLACLVFPLTWLYFRRRGNRFAFPIAILTVCSVEFLSSATDNPMSEAVYLALSLLLFLWADQREQAGQAAPSWGATLAGCGLLIAVPAVRTIGVAAVAAALAVLAVRMLARKPGERRVLARETLPVLVAIGFLLLWFLGVQHGGGGYFHDVFMRNPPHPALGRASAGEMLARPWHNLPKQTAYAAELLLAGTWIKPTWFTPALLAVAIVLLGWWKDLRERSRFAALYFPCYLGIVFLWPYDVGARILVPVLPLLWAYLFEGTDYLVHAAREGKRWLRIGGLVWAVAALTGVALAYLSDAASFRRQEMAAALFWTLTIFALALAWRPLTRVAGRPGRHTANLLVTLCAILLAGVSLAKATPRIVRRARGTLPMGDAQRSMYQASRWILVNTAPDASILTTYASRMHFATGRRTVYLPVTLATERFREIEQRDHPQYLFIVEAGDSYYTPNDAEKFAVLQSVFGSRLRQVHHFDGGSIYAFAAER